MATEKLDTATRREQIAEAALALISEKGMQGLAIASLARRVGLVNSALYRHFNGKDEVLDAMLDLISDRLMTNVKAVRRESAPPLDQLRQLLMRHIRLIRENQALPRIVFSEEIYSGKPERRTKLFNIISRYLTNVSDIFSEGQKNGTIRPDTDPLVLAVMFLGLIQPAAILWHLSNNKFDVTKQAEKAWGIFADGLSR
ncbi:MAG: TetR/AcrR family transcriptional regulator [Deltaproteobacteria bacterium]|nr:TetR/AcrR family transcriptional regulator [Deltaproteobacteria bacterium]